MERTCVICGKTCDVKGTETKDGGIEKLFIVEYTSEIDDAIDFPGKNEEFHIIHENRDGALDLARRLHRSKIKEVSALLEDRLKGTGITVLLAQEGRMRFIKTGYAGLLNSTKTKPVTYREADTDMKGAIPPTCKC